MNSDSFMLEGNQCGAIFVFFITIEFILSRMFRVWVRLAGKHYCSIFTLPARE